MKIYNLLISFLAIFLFSQSLYASPSSIIDEETLSLPPQELHVDNNELNVYYKNINIDYNSLGASFRFQKYFDVHAELMLLKEWDTWVYAVGGSYFFPKVSKQYVFGIMADLTMEKLTPSTLSTYAIFKITYFKYFQPAGLIGVGVALSDGNFGGFIGLTVHVPLLYF